MWVSARSTVACALFSLAAVHAQSQAPARPADASAPHEKLGFFEGTWTIVEMEAQGFRETCAWLPEGRRHMVCRATWNAANGPRAGMSVFSYSPRDSTYLYHGFRAGGSVALQQGAPLANGWRFSGEQGSGASRVRTRVTITSVSADEMSFREDTSTGDEPFKVGAAVRYRRIRE